MTLIALDFLLWVASGNGMPATEELLVKAGGILDVIAEGEKHPALT